MRATRSTMPKPDLLSLPPVVRRKLRSELPRRKRTRISPIVQLRRSNSSGSSQLSVNSSSCSFIEGDVSCESSRASVRSESKPSKANLKKRKHGESEGCGELASYGGKCEVEASESSCVESNYPWAGNGACGESSRVKPKSRRGKRAGIAKVIEEEKEDSNVERMNDASGIKEQTEVVSCISGAESHFGVQSPEKTEENTGKSADQEQDQCEISENFFGKSLAAISNSESTINQRPDIGLDLEADSLACTEHFSFDSQETTYTDEIFLDSSDFSDYTPSLFIDSGSEFSERSVDDSAPSPTFALLVQYRGDFSRSMSAQGDGRVASRIKEESIDQSRYARFEDEEDEESYAMLRKRERRVMECSRTTQYGPLIFQQRLNMVHWIIQHCKNKNLEQETLFLGVNLLERFLSKGFFKTKRGLQIAGIACISLATRIEENQPYNSVRVRSFSVGGNVYTRCEVVAMEWLVQEVLGFKCFLPTIFNFLWFYLKAAKAEEAVEKRAKYLAVLLLPDQDQMNYLPSTVAAAVVILASLEEGQDSSIQNIIETHIRTKRDDLHECIESLEWLLGYV